MIANFGESTALPCARTDVTDDPGLLECPDASFAPLVLLARFIRGEPVPDLALMAQCLRLLN